jgi:hypothetical protein
MPSNLFSDQKRNDRRKSEYTPTRPLLAFMLVTFDPSHQDQSENKKSKKTTTKKSKKVKQTNICSKEGTDTSSSLGYPTAQQAGDARSRPRHGDTQAENPDPS